MQGTFKFIERIQDEIDEAEEYIKLAHMFKTIHPDTAKLFLDIAKDECEHAEKLIEFKQKLMSQFKSATVSESVKEMWNYIHPLLSTEVADLKREIFDIERSL